METDKENVQPRGRAPVNTAPEAAQPVKAESVVAQYRDWEHRLRSYTGSDPLAVWERYLQWVKDTDASGYKDALQRCVKELPQEKYQNEGRYLRVWIKYAGCLGMEEQGEVLRHVVANRIGEQHALLYVAYATFLEKLHDYDGARQKYEDGIERGAFPVSRLERDYEKFQTRMASRRQRSSVEAARLHGKRKKQSTPYKPAVGGSSGSSSHSASLEVYNDKKSLSAGPSGCALSATHDGYGALKEQRQRKRHESQSYLPELLEDEEGTPMCFEEARAMDWFHRHPRMQPGPSPPVACSSAVAPVPTGSMQSVPQPGSASAPRVVPTIPDISPLHGVSTSQQETPAATPSVTLNTRAAMDEINGMFMQALPSMEEGPEPTITFATRAAMGAIDDMFQQDLSHDRQLVTPRVVQAHGVHVDAEEGPVVEENDEFVDGKENIGDSQQGRAPPSSVDMAAMDARALQELSLADDGEMVEGLTEDEENSAEGEEVVPPQRVFVDNPDMDEIEVLCDDTHTVHSPDPAAARSLHYSSEEVLAVPAQLTIIDPHAEELRNSLLAALTPSLDQWPGVSVMEEEEAEMVLEVLSKKNVANEFIELNGEAVAVLAPLGSGTYAQCFQVDQVEKDGEDTLAALKYEQPADKWEFYIGRVLHGRLAQQRSSTVTVDDDDVRSGGESRFVEMKELHMAGEQASLLLTSLGSYGTLQELVNAYRIQGQTMPEPVAKFYTMELLLAVRDMHACRILHCDIKPDNILIRHPESWGAWNTEQPATWAAAGLQLIDFGRAVDLELLPPSVAFHGDSGPGCFRCIEMQEGRPWTFQIDTYGVAAVIHFMLFGEYIQVQRLTDPSSGTSSYRLKTPFKRYWEHELWEALFQALLNWQPLHELPPWGGLLTLIQHSFQNNPEDARSLQTQLRKQAIMLHHD